MRILVTGAAGFAGSHLCESLVSQEHEVAGFLREQESADNLQGLDVAIHRGDITDFPRLQQLVREVRPERVYHLAAFTAPSQSFETPKLIYEINFLGTVNLLTALLQSGCDCRVLAISSADVYGSVGSTEVPLREDRLPKPENPYSGSKAAVDVLVQQYHRSFGVPIVIARPFNHTGPRQAPQFVCSSFARQIAQAEVGGERKMKVGNLDVSRDFSDVRDIVRGYTLLLEKGVPGEIYHLCSGRGTPLRQIAESLRTLSTVPVSIEEDPALMRSHDSPVSYGDFSKARDAVGWEPTIPLEATLADLLTYWREQAAKSPSVSVSSK